MKSSFLCAHIKRKNVSIETYSKNTKERISVISKVWLKKKIKKLSIQTNLYLCCQVIICCISCVAQESEFLVNFLFPVATIPVTSMISSHIVTVNRDFSTFCFILPELLICGCYFTFLIQCHSGFSQCRNGLTFFKLH